MSKYNVEDILADLEAGAEKTAEDTFLSSLTEETEDVSEEKVAEDTESKEEESTKEKTAEEATEATKEETTEEKTAEEAVEETEEKVAEAAETEEDPTEEKVAEVEDKEVKEDLDVDGAVEKVAETQAIPADKELVKMAQEFGRIAAHSLFTELAALGIAMPTNGEMAVPPISQVSRPQDSPVTVARDAKEQEEAGHAPYDKVNAHKPDGTGGYMKEKKASFVDEDLVKRMYTKIYSQEEK